MRQPSPVPCVSTTFTEASRLRRLMKRAKAAKSKAVSELKEGARQRGWAIHPPKKGDCRAEPRVVCLKRVSQVLVGAALLETITVQFVPDPSSKRFPKPKFPTNTSVCAQDERPGGDPDGLKELATPASTASTATPGSELSSTVSSAPSEKLERVVAQLSRLKLDFSEDVDQECAVSPTPPSCERTPKIDAIVSSLREAMGSKPNVAAKTGKPGEKSFVLPTCVSCEGG